MKLIGRFALAQCFLLLFSILQTATAQCPALVWSDEFDGTSLDSSKWTAQIGDGCDINVDLCGWGNNELQSYQQGNIDVSGGTLKITAKKENVGGREYTSARIRTLGQADFDLAGAPLRLEARMKVPAGKGLWPAFWMLPSDVEVTRWPEFGEIDIMEFIGREPKNAHGYIHAGKKWNDRSVLGGPLALPTDVSDDFHVFTVIKTRDRIDRYLDNHYYQSVTKDDLPPMYTWPFESNFHFIMNLAVAGHWPELPDENTVFPNSLEVDYVRVYDLSGTSNGHIAGEKLVRINQQEVTYCIEDGPNYTSVSWTVPAGASYTEASETCINVSFATASGYVQAEAESCCGVESFSIPVDVHPYFGKEFSLIGPNDANDESTYLGSTGIYTVENNAVTYIRNIAEMYDNIYLETMAISNLQDYVNGNKKFFMDIKKTTSAPCTQVFVQLENSASAGPDNYPTGRHSRYMALIDDTDEWQRLEFSFYDQRDYSVTSVDRVVILIDSGLERGDTYYIRNFDVATPGCTNNCENLSTNTCRKRAKSEAGACADGINNDWGEYDGDGPMDCEDSDCWDDPACSLAPPYPTDPPTSNPTVTNPSPTDPPTMNPTKSPVQTPAPTPSPTTSTPGSQITCGVPETCTSAVLGTDVGGSTCAESIEWVMNVFQKSEIDACYQVAVDDHPGPCGACHPGTDGFYYYPFDCGAPSLCNDNVLNTHADGSKCGDRMLYLMNALGYTQEDACRLIAGQEFPSECGECIYGVMNCGDPTTCTNQVLDTVSNVFTCRDRISYVVYADGMDEFSACAKVANEAANAPYCGPCNP